MDFEQPQSAPAPELTELRGRCESLERLVMALLVLLLVVTGTMWMFLRRQVKIAGADLAMYQAQTTNMVAQYKKSEPMADDLFRKFQEFGRTNPDFVPYLAKYGISPNSPIGKAPLATNRAPVTPPKRK